MRLNRKEVQSRINDMWEALANSPRSEDADIQAVLAEKRMLAQLALQDRMDEHAPEMLEALKCLRAQYASAMRLHGHDVENDGNPYITRADAVIAKIEKE